ncbi:hypothetical protein SAMN04487958_1114 [Vreelandella subterranea]|uniref:Uncharacterized protein n=1 Tax=Vreelandella subterranea TaxID=416874 RepID=A0A1H9VVL5_9GAMM|nr:hypothetical protein SAMN04487958_1114 [Halomonas subterranea]
MMTFNNPINSDSKSGAPLSRHFLLLVMGGVMRGHLISVSYSNYFIETYSW